MSHLRRVSRTDRHVKRRNNKRNLFIFIGLAILFSVILLSLIAFGNKEKNDVNNDIAKNNDIVEEDNESLNEEQNDNQTELSTEEEDDLINEVDEVEEVVIQLVESTDENVIEAYTGNWKAIGTKQQGPHTTNYNEGSDDRIEIKQAVAYVTGISESNIIEHWVGNGGDQKVIATVSDKETKEFFHVYLTWIDEEGWQPTKVEKIKQFKKAQTE